MGDIVGTDPMPAVEELKILSNATTGSGLVEPTTTGGSGGGDGCSTSCPCSLTKGQQEDNLTKNLRTALKWCRARDIYRARLDISDSWVATTVEKFRSSPCLERSEVENYEWFVGETEAITLTSLDLAILMGDLKIVQKILDTSSVSGKLLHGSFIDQKKLFMILFNHLSLKELCFLFTPLHLAVLNGASDIVDVLLENGADVNAQNWLMQTPLDFACKMGNVPILQQLLAEDEDKKSPLHVAVRQADVDFMRKLPSQDVNALDFRKRTPLHYLATKHFYEFDVRETLQYLDQEKKLDVKALDSAMRSAFYVAIICCNTELVIALLESFKDQIGLNEACNEDIGPPIEIAFEGGDNFRHMERILMECEPVKSYVESLYRDRQVYVDAANAILVGTALIASVTFASWLQPPLSYTSYFGEGYSCSVPTPSTSNFNYVDVEHNIALRAFWIFNALSFYFAIGAVVCGARIVLPRRHLFIRRTVEKLRTNLLVTSTLLACAVLCVIIAFAIAGTIVLTPLVKYQWYMIGSTLVGGIVCIGSLGFLVKSIKEIFSNTRDNRKALNEGIDNLREEGYVVPSSRDIEYLMHI